MKSILQPVFKTAGKESLQLRALLVDAALVLCGLSTFESMSI